MATKSKTVKSVDSLHGTINGTRFKVVLDDLKLQDKWDANILPVLQKDGLGKADLTDGAIRFIFKDTAASTVAFTAEEGHLVISAFFVESDGKEEA